MLYYLREGITRKMFCCKLEAGEYVFKQGDDANSFFVIGLLNFFIIYFSCVFIFDNNHLWIEQGEVEVIINNEVKRKLKSWDGFGDLALLYNAPRSASIKTLKTCFFWAIDRAIFKKVVQELTTKVYEDNRNFIESIKFFRRDWLLSWWYAITRSINSLNLSNRKFD